MRNSPPKHRLRICLLSSHPFLLKQLQELLSNSRVPVNVRQIQFSPKISALTIPRANVYLIDSHGHKPLTESLISQILSRYPKARFLVLSERSSEEEHSHCCNSGLRGFWITTRRVPSFPARLKPSQPVAFGYHGLFFHASSIRFSA